MLLRDVEDGQNTVKEMGLASEVFEVMSLIFTFRLPTNSGNLGSRMSLEQREELKTKYSRVNLVEQLNLFMESLPREMLFVMRSISIVRALNLSLGGSTAERLTLMGESAIKGLWQKRASQGRGEEENHVSMLIDSEIEQNSSYKDLWMQTIDVFRLKANIFVMDWSFTITSSLVKWYGRLMGKPVFSVLDMSEFEKDLASRQFG